MGYLADLNQIADFFRAQVTWFTFGLIGGDSWGGPHLVPTIISGW